MLPLYYNSEHVTIPNQHAVITPFQATECICGPSSQLKSMLKYSRVKSRASASPAPSVFVSCKQREGQVAKAGRGH